MPTIRAALTHEATRASAEWIFVDLGFAQKTKSCGLLVSGDVKPRDLSFSELQAFLVSLVTSGADSLNLLLEAPLSISFGVNGNPTGRSVERRNGKSRYWYVGLGCSVLVAATYLLRAIHDAQPSREVRLFEGFVSFKPKGERSSHSNDVLRLRNVIWEGNPLLGRVVPAEELAASEGDQVKSAFMVSGMNFGVPPVVVVDG
jgi:hypothetical protein